MQPEFSLLPPSHAPLCLPNDWIQPGGPGEHGSNYDESIQVHLSENKAGCLRVESEPWSINERYTT